MSESTELLGRLRRVAQGHGEMARAFRELDRLMSAGGHMPTGWQPAGAPVDDSAAYPWALDLHGMWHRRPDGDLWRPFKDGYEGPQCMTKCGSAIYSAHVADSRPDVDDRPGETVCLGCG